jgi:hypothetical protein
MQQIVISHCRCSSPKISFFGRKVRQDYETPFGMVRETAFINKAKPATYKLMKTREPVKVVFDILESDL